MSTFAADMLAQKGVLITGGGTGIGRALALAFAAHGAKVAVVARRQELLEQTVAMIEQAGGQAIWRTLDIRDEEAVERVVEEVWQSFGRIDVLINNAGGNFLSPATAMRPRGFRSVIDINVVGTFLMSRAVGARMIEDGQGGRVINMSATNAERGSPMMVHSGASKAGINSMTETLAVEWGSAGITVNAILPGPVRTEGSDERLWTDPELVNRLESRIPLGRFATPDDITPLALFLASPAGAFITGSLLVVDGGDRLRSIFG
jgi:NAD(P)-dependent dehydrogenase (short-subunit alcohol dehydrogenase family)